MSELKPCPFCKGTDLFIQAYMDDEDKPRYFVVICQNIDCRAEGPVDLGKSGAIEKWNTRKVEA